MSAILSSTSGTVVWVPRFSTVALERQRNVRLLHESDQPLSAPKIVVVGSNHEYAPIAVREQLAFNGDSLTRGLRALRETVGEGLILSTCNRTEIYAVGEDPDRATSQIFDFLSGYHSVPTRLLEQASYVHSAAAAVEHLFRVASGLDSMVLGEPQILSQIRDALNFARDAESVGPMLQRLATDALKTGKRARTETDISRNRVSIAHAAVDLARDELGILNGKSALVLGAGKMATLAAKLLRAHGIGKLTFINRTFPRAQRLAQETGGLTGSIDRLDEAIAEADVVIGAVLVEEPIVTASHIRPRATPLLIVDLGVPRNVHPDCGLVPQVTVRDVDALEPVAQETRRQYEGEVAKVETLVQTAVAAFDAWARSRSGASAIGTVRQRAETMQQAEVERALSRLSHLSDRDQQIVRSLAAGLVNKMLHDPMLALRSSGSEEEIDRILTVLGANSR